MHISEIGKNARLGEFSDILLPLSRRSVPLHLSLRSCLMSRCILLVSEVVLTNDWWQTRNSRTVFWRKEETHLVPRCEARLCRKLAHWRDHGVALLEAGESEVVIHTSFWELYERLRLIAAVLRVNGLKVKRRRQGCWLKLYFTGIFLPTH